MSKIIVIDSLSRSGTTLLSSIMHSQKDISAYRGVFHEPLACNYARWPHGYVFHSVIEKNKTININYGKRLSRWTVFSKIPFGQQLHYNLIWNDLKNNSMRVLIKRNQIIREENDVWEDIFETPPQNIEQLDEIYQRLARGVNAKLLFFRWNQGISYYLKWLRNENHYWVTILRNPMSRACSAKKSHNWSWRRSLKSSKYFAEKVNEAKKHPRFYMLYYEDLVVDPIVQIRNIFEFLGHSASYIEVNNLKGQDGKPYKTETVDNIKEEGGSHLDGRVVKGVYHNAVDRYILEMPSKIKKCYKDALASEGLYKRYF